MVDEGGTRSWRQLGLHERYCVARHNTGSPPVLAFVAVIDPAIKTLQQEQEQLQRRIQALIQAYPLLSCSVGAPRSRTPNFSSRGNIDVGAVLSPIEYRGKTIDVDNILTKELNGLSTASEVLEKAPLWRVQIIASAGADHHDDAKPFAVLLTIHHVLSDGRGSGTLLELLLGDVDIPSAPREEATPPVASDALVKTPLTYALGMFYSEVLVPKLPSFLQPYLAQPPSWPASEAQLIQKSPLDTPKAFKTILCPVGTISGLKALARDNGVKTVHPVIHSLCAVAAYAVSIRGRQTDEKDTRLQSSTPINIRSKDLEAEQTTCTGNFVGTLTWNAEVSPETSFWDLTRDYAADVSSPAKRATASHNVGALAWLPDSPSFTSSNPQTPTQWEEWLWQKAHSRTPIGSAFEVSNLGKIAISRNTGVRQVAWAARTAAAGPLFSVEVCGLEGGEDSVFAGANTTVTASDLSMCVAWHKGLLPPAEDGSERELIFVNVLEQLLQSLLRSGQEGGARGGLTVAQLLQGLPK